MRPKVRREFERVKHETADARTEFARLQGLGGQGGYPIPTKIYPNVLLVLGVIKHETNRHRDIVQLLEKSGCASAVSATLSGYRIFSVLEDCGLVQKDPKTKRYDLTPAGERLCPGKETIEKLLKAFKRLEEIDRQ